MMINALARCSALALGTVWAGVAWASALPATPVNSWTFIRNDNGAALFGGDTNTPVVGPTDGESPNTLSTAAIVGTWGGAVSLEIGEVARVRGFVAWDGSGDGFPGLRFGLFNSDGNLLDGSPGYMVYLGNGTDNTFDRTLTASTFGFVFSQSGAQNLNATVLDEQGTWEDDTVGQFKIEVARTDSDSVEVRFLLSSQSVDPVNINAVATHSAANGEAAARTFDFNSFGMHFSALNNAAPDSAAFFDVNIAVVVPGDLDGDGFVGIADLNLILGNWNQNVSPGDALAGDPSDDGFVGIEDLNAVLGSWNAGTPPGAPSELATIPEPAMSLLVLCGLSVLGGRHGIWSRQPLTRHDPSRQP